MTFWSQSMTDPVTTGQIYWGAVPFVVIQCVMVGLVIGFPQMVMHYKGQAPTIDPSKIEIRIPSFGPPVGSPFGAPTGGLNIPPPPPGSGQLSPDLSPPPTPSPAATPTPSDVPPPLPPGLVTPAPDLAPNTPPSPSSGHPR